MHDPLVPRVLHECGVEHNDTPVLSQGRPHSRAARMSLEDEESTGGPRTVTRPSPACTAIAQQHPTPGDAGRMRRLGTRDS